ncbi:MAG: ABC transporter permease [Acidobacteria bacterium]|nr:ABC transporter permease [Acidobacteriota bacterium]
MMKALTRRLRALLRRGEMENELDEELRFHIEKETEQNVRRGMTPAEARRAALVEFGGVESIKEECRDVRGVRLLDDLLQDLRYALRVLTKSPAFTLVAVLSLALGVGVNASVFGFVNAVLLKPLPLPRHEELVRIQDDNLPAYSDYLAFSERARGFRGLAAYDFDSYPLRAGGPPARAAVTLVSANYFDVLEVRPALGRGFAAEEGTQPGAASVAVISHGLWRDRFGADPSVVGKTFTLRRVPFTVIGVAPPEFTGVSLGQRQDLWVPFAAEGLLRPEENRLKHPDSYQAHVIGRLAPGVTLAEVQAAVEVVAAQQDQVQKVRLFTDNPGEQPATPRTVTRATAVEMGPRDRQMSWFGVAGVLIVVGLVLLAACANVANLLLGRAAARRREIAVRLALGASRGRIVRQLLTESLLLSLAGAAGGLLLSRWAGDLLLSLMKQNSPAEASSVTLDLSLDWRMLLYATLLAVLTGVAFGLVPALQASRPDVVTDLKAETAAAAGGARRRRLTFRNALVVTQVAISALLLVPAGLLLRSVRLAETSGYGFPVAERYVAAVDLEALGYDDKRRRLVGEQLLDKVRETPGVRSATMAHIVPLVGGTMVVTLEVEGEAPGQQAEDVFEENGSSFYALDQPGSLYMNTVDTRYFETMGLPLVAGRDFDERDDASAPDVVVVNETLARRLAKGGQALGRRLVERDPTNWKPKPLEVVGVVKDSKYIWPSERPRYFAYRPRRQYTQSGFGPAHLIVHAAGDQATVSKLVRSVASTVDPDLSVEGVTRLDELIEHRVGETKLVIWVSAAVGALALLLAAVGLYGVMAYSVAGRTKEIGVRMALGAGRGRVRRMILADGLVLAAAGTLVGLLVSAACMRLMRSMLYGVSDTDPLTYAAVALFLTGVALLACYVPARRATKVDPMVALRYE